MLSLDYEGWFECRLATDPDPADEPRGVSGWTFAVAGEPDLDRVIRLQPEHAINRVPGPRVGVVVRQVSVSGEQQTAHPLLGASVDLLDNPVFEGRNGLAADSAQEAILPFHLRIRQDGITLRREHRHPATGEHVAERPQRFEAPPGVRAAAGIGRPGEYRAARKVALKQELAACADPARRVGLEKRLRDFDDPAVAEIAQASLSYWVGYRIAMGGPYTEVEDPLGALGFRVYASPWVAEFWLGGWDADALCGYMKGRLDLP